MTKRALLFLVAGMLAVDAGADIAGNALDFFNRMRPNGSAPDIGALEFGSTQSECIPRFPAVSTPLSPD
jgi:hypothetical protein